jgi:cytoskeleton protein RodZ
LAGFGEKLRRERELRGISLDQIATATKISTRMLKALEDEKFDLLPGGIFNKGFIRAYAKFLGIDEDQAVADYVAATGPEEPVNNLPQIADVPERAARQVDDEGTISWNTIVVLVLLVAMGYGGWTYYKHHKAERESRVASVPVAAPSTVPVEPPANPTTPSTANVSNTTGPAKAPAETTTKNVPATLSTSPAVLKTESIETAPKPSVDLIIRTSEESWVQAVADGKTVFSETLPAATEKHVTAARRITLTVGNAGGVEVTYNGATLPDIGGPGKVRTIVFSPSKFEFQSEDQ